MQIKEVSWNYKILDWILFSNHWDQTKHLEDLLKQNVTRDNMLINPIPVNLIC